MDIVNKYFPELSELQKEKFDKLFHLYNEWNAQVNLISKKDIVNLPERHVLYSLCIAKLSYFKPGTLFLDAGTGGGFPGIPLAILLPNCHFHLVDSVRKKINIVKNIAENLELSNVTTELARVEDIKGKFDFILARAVAELPVFCSWVSNKVNKNNSGKFRHGIIYLKGGEVEMEIKKLKRIRYSVYSIGEIFKEEFFETKKAIHIWSSS